MDPYKNKKNGYLVSILYQVPILFYNAITQSFSRYSIRNKKGESIQKPGWNYNISQESSLHILSVQIYLKYLQNM